MTSVRNRTKLSRASWLLAITLATCVAGPALADQYVYDAQSRLTQVTYTSGGITAYTYDAVGNILAITSSLTATGVEEPGRSERFEFALGQNTPNPGSGTAVIRFSIPTKDRVTLRLFDVAGRVVMTPVDATLDPGIYTARINAERLAGGVYFYRLESGARRLNRRLVVLH